MRLQWDDFSQGIRPRWEYGKLYRSAYQKNAMGFAELLNLIVENGTARKRQGIVNSSTKDDGTAIVSHDGLAFANGIGAFAWQVGFLYYLLSFFNQSAAPVRQDLSLSFPVGQFWYALGKAASFLDTGVVKRSVILNEDASKTYSTTEFGLIVEAAGRRFWFNSPQANPGFTLISFVGGVLVASVTLESYIPAGTKIVQQSDTGPGQYYVSLNYDPNVNWSAFCGASFCSANWGPAQTHTAIWWYRNGVYYSVVTPGLGTTSQLQSLGDSQIQHTISSIATALQTIDVRASRSSALYSYQLAADLVSANVIAPIINGVSVSPITFVTNHVTTMAAIVTAINANTTLSSQGILASYSGSGRNINLSGQVTAMSLAVTSGATNTTATGIKTVFFSGVLIASNSTQVNINGVALAPVVFTTDSPTTIALIVAAINANTTLQAMGVSAYYAGSGLSFTLWGKMTDCTMIVTLGASQATVSVTSTPPVDTLQNFMYSDGSGATLVSTDPILLSIRGYGYIRWAAWGGGLFVGTSLGVYELVSGLGPGFSPLAGGFFPQLISNVAAIDIKHTKSQVQNQGHTISKNCVVYVCDVDQVAVLNRYSKQVQKIRLDLPDTHAIDSFAPLGDTKVAILCVNVTNRAAWSTTTGYDASENFLYILDELDGSLTKFDVTAISIFGLDGRGLLVKQVDSLGVVQVGMIPWRDFNKYSTTPMPAASVYTDATLTATTPVTARITTLPIQGSLDLGDQKNIKRVALRVKDSQHLKISQKGYSDPSEWFASDPGFDIVAPGLFSGDVDLQINSQYRSYWQLQIEDNSQYNLEVLAFQTDDEVTTEAVTN